MHLLWDKPLNAIVILGSLIFVALFLGFTLMDAEGYRENLIYNSTIDESQPVVVPVDPITGAEVPAVAAP
jgi:cytochrome c oxidase subunit 4